jgi:hypothetical protein
MVHGEWFMVKGKWFRVKGDWFMVKLAQPKYEGGGEWVESHCKLVFLNCKYLKTNFCRFSLQYDIYNKPR